MSGWWKPVFATVVAGLLGYGALLVHASRTSIEHVLAPGQAYHFCGLYLDCHLSVAVEQVEIVPLQDGGVQYRVRVRFASDARRATLELRNAEATLLDDRGVRTGPVAGPTGVRLAADSAIGVEFVFEADRPLVNPRLHVVKGHWMERLAERFLVGDPDSWHHRPVTLALE